jgi:hypothetical protein
MEYRIRSRELQNFLILQTEGVQVFFLEDLDLYVVSHFDGELYRLGFVDLRTRVGLKVRCDRLEEETAASTELKDIPWERMRLKVVFTLYPLNCFEEGAEGALALKINIEPHWLMYDWVKIARAILSSWSEQYVMWLRERFGPVDAVKIVGPGA